jgi:hypothetical protein
MRGEEQLIPVVMRLRAAAPYAWDEFVKAMVMLAAVKAAELVKAPTETVHQVQGQARAFDDIANMLREAPMKAQKAEEQRHGKRATGQSGPSYTDTAGH